jgi:hypothetical protein
MVTEKRVNTMRKSRKGIREISWGYNEGDGGTCIYDNGHRDKQEFLDDLMHSFHLDTPADILCHLTVDRVQHLRFRSMGPAEAKAWGVDYGVMDCTEENRGYPVTAVII